MERCRSGFISASLTTTTFASCSVSSSKKCDGHRGMTGSFRKLMPSSDCSAWACSDRQTRGPCNHIPTSTEGAAKSLSPAVPHDMMLVFRGACVLPQSKRDSVPASLRSRSERNPRVCWPGTGGKPLAAMSSQAAGAAWAATFGRSEAEERRSPLTAQAGPATRLAFPLAIIH